MGTTDPTAGLSGHPAHDTLTGKPATGAALALRLAFAVIMALAVFTIHWAVPKMTGAVDDMRTARDDIKREILANRRQGQGNRSVNCAILRRLDPAATELNRFCTGGS